MKVLHLIRSIDPDDGGPVEGLRQSCLAAARRGWTFEVATLDAPGTPWLAAFPAPTHALGPAASKYGYSSRLLPWLNRNKGHYDAMIVHGLWQYHGRAVWRALRRGGPPYYVYPHGMLGLWFRRAHPLKHVKKLSYWLLSESHLVRDARATFFTTREEARQAPQSFSPYRANPVIVGFGTDAPPPLRGGSRRQLFLDAHPSLAGKRLLLFLSRIDPIKGCDLLVEAFARIAAQDESLQLVFAGPDTAGLRRRLELQAEKHGIDSRVTFTGMLVGDLKWGALQAAEVFALPSHHESFGLAIVEALAVGLPVLISNQVAIWPEIESCGAGFVGADTLEGTQSTLARWLATGPVDRERMRDNAMACFAAHFQIDAVTDRVLATLADGRS